MKLAWTRTTKRIRASGPRPADVKARISATLKGHVAHKGSGVGKKCEYRGHVLRSSYELRFAVALDRLGVRWQYESTRFNMGDRRRYTPDFYLTDYDTHIEVKGYLTAREHQRLAAFQCLYPEVRLVLAFRRHIEALEACDVFSLDALSDQHEAVA